MGEAKTSKEKNSTKILIPTTLFEKIETEIKGTGFTSVTSYVTYVLRESLAKKKEPEKPFDEEDEEKIKARLRALGYID